jgi:glycosyltransferase involved in cell wall biosynthesis
MYQPLISIIIPVYGVEKWIGRSLMSAIEQDYDNLEIVIVNDASKDKSEKIIRELVRRYGGTRLIKLITHEKNQGLAIARKTGVANCCGDFIFHLDGDDWIEKNCISILSSYLGDGNFDVDIVSGNCCDVYERKKVNRRINYNLSSSLEIAYSMMRRNLSFNIWNRLIRRTLYDGLEIPEINNGEDYVTMTRLMYKANKVIQLGDITYNYSHLNESSFQKRRKSLENIKDRELAVLYLKDYFKYDNIAIESLDIGYLGILAVNLISSSKYSEIVRFKIPEPLNSKVDSPSLNKRYRFILNLHKKKYFVLIFVINKLFEAVKKM